MQTAKMQTAKKTRESFPRIGIVFLADNAGWAAEGVSFQVKIYRYIYTKRSVSLI